MRKASSGALGCLLAFTLAGCGGSGGADSFLTGQTSPSNVGFVATPAENPSPAQPQPVILPTVEDLSLIHI